jgi:hypothetical protein
MWGYESASSELEVTPMVHGKRANGYDRLHGQLMMQEAEMYPTEAHGLLTVKRKDKNNFTVTCVNQVSSVNCRFQCSGQMITQPWSSLPVALIKKLQLVHDCQNVVFRQDFTQQGGTILSRKRNHRAENIMHASGNITQNLPKSAIFNKKNVAKTTTNSLLSIVQSSSKIPLSRKQASTYMRQHVNLAFCN